MLLPSSGLDVLELLVFARRLFLFPHLQAAPFCRRKHNTMHISAAFLLFALNAASVLGGPLGLYVPPSQVKKTVC